MCRYLAALVAAAHALTRVLVVILTIAITVTITLEVVFRYVLQLPLIGSEELATYIMVWLAMLSAALAVREKAHIGMEALINLTPAAVQRVIAHVNHGLILVFLGFLVYWGIIHTLAVVGQMSPSLRISMVWPYLAIPVGGGLMFLQFLALTLGLGQARPSTEGQPQPKEVPTC
jgi:TRAP-type C4-dicarboxylate transport system permease small subunit